MTLIDIGVLDADGRYLYLQKDKVDQQKAYITEVTLVSHPINAGRPDAKITR
jgi:hypothetical protein